MDKGTYDLVIIGAGPVGLFADYYSGLRELKTILIESTGIIGGQVSALYPEKRIFDLPAFFGVLGKEFIHKMNQQNCKFNNKILLNSIVTNLEKKDRLFNIQVNNKDTIQAKTVLMATGNGSFSPRKIKVSGSFEAENRKKLIYSLPDFSKNKNDTFAVVGGGNTAVDFANELLYHHKKVYLIHRRNNFRALETSLDNIKQNNRAIIVTPKKIISLNNNGTNIIIKLQNTKNKVINNLKVNQLVGGYGFISSSNVINKWSLKPKKYNFHFLTDSKQMTSIRGLFAVGDASSYDGKNSIIVTGFGEVPIAINEAINYFDPNRGGPLHSTSLDAKKIFKN